MDGKIPIIKIPAIDVALSVKERYNPFQNGHGAHKTDKHASRVREKHLLRKQKILEEY